MKPTFRLVVNSSTRGGISAASLRGYFAESDRVEVREAFDNDADALLTSAFRCEPYGCRSGSSDETLGQMLVFDTRLFEPASPYFPRFLISNAVWREEPRLDLAVAMRLDLLQTTVQDHNQRSDDKIRRLAIQFDVLGLWQSSDAPLVERGVAILKQKLSCFSWE